MHAASCSASLRFRRAADGCGRRCAGGQLPGLARWCGHLCRSTEHLHPDTPGPGAASGSRTRASAAAFSALAGSRVHHPSAGGRRAGAAAFGARPDRGEDRCAALSADPAAGYRGARAAAQRPCRARPHRAGAATQQSAAEGDHAGDARPADGARRGRALSGSPDGRQPVAIRSPTGSSGACCTKSSIPRMPIAFLPSFA